MKKKETILKIKQNRC